MRSLKPAWRPRMLGPGCRMPAAAEKANSEGRSAMPSMRAIGLMTFLVMHATTLHAQSRTWFVWINVSSSPATIGVADSSYNVPGWTTLAGPFADDRAAWREACRLHRGAQYHSPDIAAGRVYC